MKRPLCVLAVVLTAVVWLYLELFYADLMADLDCPEADGTYVEITGRVSGKEFQKSYTDGLQTVIYVTPTESGPSSGREVGEISSNSMMVQCYMEGEDSGMPAIGTYVRIRGRVKEFASPTNPGEFDSRLYYTTMKIAYRLYDVEMLAYGGKVNLYREFLYRLKVYLGASLDAVLAPEDAGIMKAMLLGDKSSLDREVQEQFKASGIIHVICISGTHIAILGMGIYEALRRIFMWMSIWVEKLRSGRHAGFNSAIHMDRLMSGLLAVFVMYSYGVMCGMGSSAFRAILMFSLHVMAPLVGRTYDILSALALAEILLLLEQPLYLYNSGFLMSFGAVIGIVVIKPRLNLEYLAKGQEMKFADESNSRTLLDGTVEGLKSSVAIGIATLPVYTQFYYTFPVHSLVLNLLVIPVMGVLLVLGVVCMLVSGLMFVVAGGTGTMISAFVGLALKLPAFGIHMILGAYKGMTLLSSVTSLL